MKLYQLHRIQKLPVSLEKAWEFFSSPHNLAKITPSKMNFQVLSGADRKVFSGQIIVYKVSPVLGIPLTWVTEITHVDPGKYFVDEQRFGPYALWHHKHFFREIPGGVEMEDIVDYKVPMGVLGRMANGLFVRKQLEGVFDFRWQYLEKHFGTFQEK